AVGGSDHVTASPEFRERLLEAFDFLSENVPAARTDATHRSEDHLCDFIPLAFEIVLQDHARDLGDVSGGEPHSVNDDPRNAMKNLWDPAEAAKCKSDLELRVYSSRLLGRDDTLVLHGGGNTSVKVRERNVAGNEEEILHVKGTGWDLEMIEAAGFAPVRLAPLLKLAHLETLSDPQMVNELAANVIRAGAPAPSVETILHAVIPHKFVDHTHADALLAITNRDDGEARVREICGEDVSIVPYVMPGFELARECAQRTQAQLKPSTIGMVLLKHGLFSFG